MKDILIAEIGVDLEERLYIKPAEDTFEKISEVNKDLNWDSDRGVIYSPNSQEWSQIMWFSQIFKASEALGYKLTTNENTLWNIHDNLLKEDLNRYLRGKLK